MFRRDSEFYVEGDLNKAKFNSPLKTPIELTGYTYPDAFNAMGASFGKLGPIQFDPKKPRFEQIKSFNDPNMRVRTLRARLTFEWDPARQVGPAGAKGGNTIYFRPTVTVRGDNIKPLPVPEPGSFVGVGMAIIGASLWLYRNRRRR
jgi:hypothetical protein